MTRCVPLEGTVDLLQLHALAPDRYPFLLESVAGHPTSGRYDVAFVTSAEWLSLTGSELTLPESLRTHEKFDYSRVQTFFDALTHWHEISKPETQVNSNCDLPFQGGWFLYLGYESAQQIESELTLPAAPFALPDALAVRCGAAIIVDRELRKTWCVVEDAKDSKLLDLLAADATQAMRATPFSQRVIRANKVCEESPQRYLDQVARVKDYLAAGDAFQVNLSRKWTAQIDTSVSAVELYDSLRRNNAAPFAGLMRWKDETLLSSSPERLVSVDRNNTVQTRPIAGTRPRGKSQSDDEVLQSELFGSLKERAEHVMLIDLERNDLGRVCVPGSIEVNELMQLESYAHVHHIVSNIRGKLRTDTGAGDVLKAVFPGGTITGCPKVRVMEIIAELEGEGRGPYTGSMGYLNLDGSLDSNILIRSLVYKDGEVTLRAGAGLVIDSDASHELLETRAKAKGLLRALGVEQDG